MSKDGAKFVPAEVREHSEESRYSEMQYSSWLDEAFDDFQKNGGLDNNKYKGKPLVIEQTNQGENGVMNSILKNAKVLPPWLELQHKIRDEIKQLLDQIDSGKTIDLETAVLPINEKIKKYNLMCPFIMQKTRLFPDLIRRQYERWL
ncbi:DUF1992 domain-containing protein [Tumebacillus lipolyticus]|uniref:DUF1992 domain-containing protein n=1 Tax=Tumebacillus lipolyticus TaxID=1280370 RepID=A0ABW4ZYX2_9BACL